MFTKQYDYAMLPVFNSTQGYCRKCTNVATVFLRKECNIYYDVACKSAKIIPWKMYRSHPIWEAGFCLLVGNTDPSTRLSCIYTLLATRKLGYMAVALLAKTIIKWYQKLEPDFYFLLALGCKIRDESIVFLKKFITSLTSN